MFSKAYSHPNSIPFMHPPLTDPICVQQDFSAIHEKCNFFPHWGKLFYDPAVGTLLPSNKSFIAGKHHALTT